MLRSHVLFAFAFALVGSACSSPVNKVPDKNAPAIEPAVITLPSATPATPAVADKPTLKLIPQNPEDRRIVLAQGYSLAAATMKGGDVKMLVTLYATDATLSLPDTTVRGAPAIATQLASLARSKSMDDFQRTSRTLTIVDDSTLADSGSYMMVLKRTPKDSVLERGRYTARWRVRKGADWVMIEDHIAPNAGKKQGAK